jgi:hypothetical protein
MTWRKILSTTSSCLLRLSDFDIKNKLSHKITWANFQSIQPHASFLTMDKKAHLSGIRIEPIELGESGFSGYT